MTPTTSRGNATGASDGDATGGLCAAAYWCANYYVAVENVANRTNAWTVDLLPQRPHYFIIEAAWRSTMAYFSVSDFRSQLAGQTATLVPVLKQNLHWSWRSQASGAIAQPIDFGPSYAPWLARGIY